MEMNKNKKEKVDEAVKKKYIRTKSNYFSSKNQNPFIIEDYISGNSIK